jgi:parvulin-like peptidyl-prolyl isomerase
VSQPVKSQFGWHIIQVVEHVRRSLPPFEAVRNEITAALIHRRAREVLDGLRARAKVEYHDPAIRALVERERRHGAVRQ